MKSDISSAKIGSLYFALFVLIGAALLVAYAFLGRWPAVQAILDKDALSGFFQATIGIAVAFAGALVAIKIALNAQRLAEQGERRQQFQQMNTFLSETQEQFGALSQEVRALLHACTLPKASRTQLEDFGLERLICEPRPGFSAFDYGYAEAQFGRQPAGYRTLSPEQYSESARKIVEHGSTAKNVFEGTEMSDDDDVTQDHARALDERLAQDGEPLRPTRAAARERLELISMQMHALATGIEDTLARFDCMSTYLSGQPVLDEKAMTDAENAVSLLRASSDFLVQADPLRLLGKAMYITDLMRVELPGAGRAVTHHGGEEAAASKEVADASPDVAQDEHEEPKASRDVLEDEQGLALAYLLIGNPVAFPGLGEFANFQRGRATLEAIESLLPSRQAYQAHFDRITRLTARSSHDSGTLEIALPAMSYLGTRTYLGHQYVKSAEGLRNAFFPYETKPDPTGNEMGAFAARDQELEDLVLKRAAGYWLGNRYEQYLAALNADRV